MRREKERRTKGKEKGEEDEKVEERNQLLMTTLIQSSIMENLFVCLFLVPRIPKKVMHCGPDCFYYNLQPKMQPSL